MYDRAERDRIVAEVAERAAAEIRRRAEVESARLREERTRLSDAFLGEQRRALAELDRAAIEHFGTVKARTEELLVALRRTIEQASRPLAIEIPPPPDPLFEPVQAAAAPSTPPPPASVPPELPPEPGPAAVPEPSAPEPVAEPALEAPEPQPSAPSASQREPFPYQSAEATVLAAQMATAGSGRDEIVGRLRARFSISDPEPIADEALARYGS